MQLGDLNRLLDVALDRVENRISLTVTEPPEGEKIIEFIPTTWPRRSKVGPPELPRLIGASIWMKSL